MTSNTVSNWLRLALLATITTSSQAENLGKVEPAPPECTFEQRNIQVDGKVSDWEGILPNAVRGANKLWFGQGMIRENWKGDGDLSYQWRGAWSGDKLCFLFEVTDDKVVEASQPSSYLCDCVEIYLDFKNRGGRRVEVLDGRTNWFDKCLPGELRGYEIHLLPSTPPKVFLDHRDKYSTQKPQNEEFESRWEGEVVALKTKTGYRIEAAFALPTTSLESNQAIGVEIGVCDDDGNGRKSIMMWTGTRGDFWLNMDGYGKARLIQASDNSETAVLRPVQMRPGQWGLVLSNAGMASVTREYPVELEFWSGADQITNVFAGYHEVVRGPNGFTGRATLPGPNSSQFTIQDDWRQDGSVLGLARMVKVSGDATNGFMSGFQFDFAQPRSWTNAEWFAPGMIYGGFDHLTGEAIGGKAHYQPGNYMVRIREDRLPAPLLSAHFADNTTLAVLNPAPRGSTTVFEGADVRALSLINSNFQFGAIGGQEKDGKLSVGYWFPGSEGQVTYAGNTYPGGQLHQWRRRYHPIQDGLVQQYEMLFRFGRQEAFAQSMASNWRWSWQKLDPAVVPHDISAARLSLTDMLAGNTLQKDGRTGIPLFINAVSNDMAKADRRAVMGFCGKNLEAVNYLLQESALQKGSRSEKLRQTAEAIAASFVKMKMSPPEGEGFDLDDGTAVCARRKEQMMYLRCFGDDMKMLLQAYVREKQLGREHPEWLAWCREFADWLLPQQRPDGGFPRSWKLGTAEIGSASPNSSFNAVSLLVHLSRVTGESKYLDAAVRAADFCWNNGQSRGRFVGGTIDNPDVLDKEAATISLEAYLALFETTREEKWLRRARGAANYAETWIYIWNVPMFEDDTAPNRHWKKGQSTVGVQLIATGHSLVDQYMCFDADEFAKLYKYTGDRHYYEVSRLLLHNTKSMLALPGRTFDLAGPGWQQEHWSLAPRRGQGLHRGWLPWVSTSHLNGIFGLMNFDRELFDKLCRAEDPN